MRSIKSLGNRIIICLLVIATTIFLQCGARNQILERRRIERSSDILGDVPRAIKEDGREMNFLIGKEAPVWLASNNGTAPKFRRYDIPGYSKPVVGNAVKHYFKFKNNITFEYDAPSWRVTNYGVGGQYRFLHESDVNAAFSNKCKHKSKSQIADQGLTHVYISALVILDLQHLSAIDSSNELDEVAKRITYIGAFWNSVNMRLNNLIKKPYVTIRIAGIILSEAPDSFKAWTGTAREPSLQNALNRMEAHLNLSSWREQFPPNSYDFVAHMSSPNIVNSDDRDFVPQGASSFSPVCGNDDRRMGNIMIWDNFSFLGIEGAVQELIAVLGFTELRWRVNLIPRTLWTAKSDPKPNTCATQQVSDSLLYAWCLNTPKEYFPPGKPLRKILPGEMMSLGQYCATLGLSEEKADSKLYPGCLKVICGRWEFSGIGMGWHWITLGRALDGTSCSSSNSMVCMEGQCVENKWTDEDY